MCIKRFMSLLGSLERLGSGLELGTFSQSCSRCDLLTETLNSSKFMLWSQKLQLILWFLSLLKLNCDELSEFNGLFEGVPI